MAQTDLLPVLAAIVPTAAHPGDTVTIDGERLNDITGVTIGGTDAEFRIVNQFRIDVTVPELTPGDLGPAHFDIRILGPNGRAAGLERALTVRARPPEPVMCADLLAAEQARSQQLAADGDRLRTAGFGLKAQLDERNEELHEAELELIAVNALLADAEKHLADAEAAIGASVYRLGQYTSREAT